VEDLLGGDCTPWTGPPAYRDLTTATFTPIHTGGRLRLPCGFYVCLVGLRSLVLVCATLPARQNWIIAASSAVFMSNCFLPATWHFLAGVSVFRMLPVILS
jgi:hypothetical protein